MLMIYKQNWDWDLKETDDEQRRRLIRGYVQVLDEIPPRMGHDTRAQPWQAKGSAAVAVAN